MQRQVREQRLNTPHPLSQASSSRARSLSRSTHDIPSQGDRLPRRSLLNSKPSRSAAYSPNAIDSSPDGTDQLPPGPCVSPHFHRQYKRKGWEVVEVTAVDVGAQSSEAWMVQHVDGCFRSNARSAAWGRAGVPSEDGTGLLHRVGDECWTERPVTSREITGRDGSGAWDLSS